MRTANKTFHIILIKPTRYDSDGYPVQWFRSPLPANTLACLYGLADDSRRRKILGDEVDIRVAAIDETNRRVDTAKLIREIKQAGGGALICLVGVQSNQFPRAVDLARPFRQNDIAVAIGGFHVSGCLSMLDQVPAEIKAAQAMGITIFAGEAEDRRFDALIRDAYAGRLKPVYNHLGQLPDLRNQPVPILPRRQVRRTSLAYSSFDLGRGCPFQCSFCCIINVQGRISRFRTADDLEKIVRANHDIGINWFFVTDDNLARNRNWEELFDRLIELREKEGIRLRLLIQVDTLCHRIPNFIEKAVRAGVDQAFIGLENINPDNLLATNKRQNHITEYRDMLLAWKKYPVVITASYIIGLANDTRASILNDIEVIKRELPIDILNLTYLTPLPGCADHKNILLAGDWMDPDLNKYDLYHRVTHHGRMSDEEWESAYRDAWRAFYTRQHMETILKRMVALGSNKKLTTINRLAWYGTMASQRAGPSLEHGLIRIKHRADRRDSLSKENPLVFYPAYWLDTSLSFAREVMLNIRLRRALRRIKKDPQSENYTDQAIAPTSDRELDTLRLFSETRGGKDAVEKHRRQTAVRARRKQEELL
jgi:hypothetical protein